MPDKRALNSALGTITNVGGGVTFGNAVPANMRRYIYKLKTANNQAGPIYVYVEYEDAP